MIEYIRKRDGRLVPFEQDKISLAIQKAVRAVNGTDMDKAGKIAREVGGILEVIYKDDRVPTVENVQDLVEKILIEKGHAKTAKAYILYRKQRESLRQTKEFIQESIEAIDSYLTQEDWRVNENANMGYSLQGLNNHIAANITSNYWLNKVYPREIADAHRNADFHVHDLGTLSVYCCGWDLRDLLSILSSWDEMLPRFVKVMPMDYKKAMAKMKEQQQKNSESAEMTEEVFN
ncbi:MAG: ATP cone domain-containing protein [Syntrophotalea acetylenica]|nr:ATP cone domain-containing protein [Syntrophotalea acetylenica]